METYDFDIKGARLLALRIAIHNFQTRPFEELKGRNLREDLHDKGLIPKGYFSYCCGHKAPFRRSGSLDAALIDLCNRTELGMLKPGMEKRVGIEISRRATLYKIRPAFNRNFLTQLENMQSEAFLPSVPVNYPITRLHAEVLEATQKRDQLHAIREEFA